MSNIYRHSVDVPAHLPGVRLHLAQGTVVLAVVEGADILAGLDADEAARVGYDLALAFRIPQRKDPTDGR
jgi:hypothetical protein